MLHTLIIFFTICLIGADETPQVDNFTNGISEFSMDFHEVIANKKTETALYVWNVSTFLL